MSRWSDASRFPRVWDGRTAALARWARPGARVLELGAGRQVLRDHLPDDCTYTPCDLADRGDGCLVFDLNAELPKLPACDLVVIGGVLEYVEDVPRLLDHLALTDGLPGVAASYATIEAYSCPRARRESGWVNGYTRADLLEEFSVAGFWLVGESTWRGQGLFLFD